MPASQVAAYWLLLGNGSFRYLSSAGAAVQDGSARIAHLFNGLALVSAFYASWALYKRWFQGDTNDLGHVTMGFLCVSSLLKRPYLTAAATLIVLLHYLFALYLVFIMFPTAAKLAKAVKKTVTTSTVVWAWVLRMYMVSNTYLWYQVLTTKVWTLLVVIQSSGGAAYEDVPVS
jgi:hypothetical protein